jgi:hypothetical protein
MSAFQEDLHELVLRWPAKSAKKVVVTGTFDQWTRSVSLTKSTSGFETCVRVPWGSKVLYKFIVDGKWMTDSNNPVEKDPAGNLNNVCWTPARPAPVRELLDSLADASPAPLPSNPIPKQALETHVNGVMEKAKETVTGSGSLSVSGTDVVDTVIAKEGTSNPVSYLASGVGAVIGNFIGVDPINGAQVAVKTPVTESAPVLPTPPQPELEVAPSVPIDIVPVNAAETQPADEKTTTSVPNGISTHEPAADAPSLGDPAVIEPSSPDVSSEQKAADVSALDIPTTLPTQSTTTLPMTPPEPSTPPPPVPTAVPDDVAAHTNGHNTTQPAAPQNQSSPPTTPKKKFFSRSASESSPASSMKDKESLKGSPGKFSTMSKKKRNSFIEKVKHIFHHDKEKEHGEERK